MSFFLLRMAKILSSMLYQAVGGKIILGGVTFSGYVTLPRQGNLTQMDVVYPAWVRLPKLGKVTQAGVKLRSRGTFIKPR